MSTIITALDIGSSKVACLMAEIGKRSQSDVNIIASAFHQSQGVRQGVIEDIARIKESVFAVIERVEKASGVRVRDVVYALSLPLVENRTVTAETQLPSGQVRNADLRRLYHHARAQITLPHYQMVHLNPTGFILDDIPGKRLPLGRRGRNLKSSIHIVYNREGPWEDMKTLIASTNAHPKYPVCSAYAAGLGCLNREELELGCTLINIGGTTTTMATFRNGALTHVDYIPLGGEHITTDIARVVATTVEAAERTKVMRGTVIPVDAHKRETLNLPHIGETQREHTNRVTIDYIISIIIHRMDEILVQAQKKMEQAGVDIALGHQIVLTGGCAQTIGLDAMAKERFSHCSVRIATPTALKGLPAEMLTPAFTTACGLIRYCAHNDSPDIAMLFPAVQRSEGRLHSALQWFKDNL